MELIEFVAALLTGSVGALGIASAHKAWTRPSVVVRTKQLNYAVEGAKEFARQLTISYNGAPEEDLLFYSMDLRNDSRATAEPVAVALNVGAGTVLELTASHAPQGRPVSTSSVGLAPGWTEVRVPALGRGESMQVRLLVKGCPEVRWHNLSPDGVRLGPPPDDAWVQRSFTAWLWFAPVLLSFVLLHANHQLHRAVASVMAAELVDAERAMSGALSKDVADTMHSHFDKVVPLLLGQIDYSIQQFGIGFIVLCIPPILIMGALLVRRIAT